MKHQGKNVTDVRSIAHESSLAHEASERDLHALQAARDLLCRVYVPPSVLIDADCRCIGFFGAVHPYLRVVRELENPSLLSIAREGVRERLRVVLRHTWSVSNGEGSDRAVLEQNERFASLGIVVAPVQVEREIFLLVSFVEKPAFSQSQFEPESLGDIPGMPGVLDQISQRRGSGENPASVEGLSPRQRTVLFLVANGRSNKQIASDLGISQRTVEAHRVIVMRKLGARNFADLMRLVATH